MYTVYSTTRTQRTVFKHCYWCTVYRGKKIEPNLYSKPGVRSVQDCLYTAYSIQRYANIAIGVQCTGKKVQPNYDPKIGVHSVQYYPYTAYSVQNLQTLQLVYSVREKKDRT